MTYSKKSKLKYKNLVNITTSGSIDSIIFQSNNVVRTNKSRLTKKDLKKLAKEERKL